MPASDWLMEPRSDPSPLLNFEFMSPTDRSVTDSRQEGDDVFFKFNFQTHPSPDSDRLVIPLKFYVIMSFPVRNKTNNLNLEELNLFHHQQLDAE